MKRNKLKMIRNKFYTKLDKVLSKSFQASIKTQVDFYKICLITTQSMQVSQYYKITEISVYNII